MTQEDEAKWSSHLPPLLACLAATTGPVLELGVGHFSTPALHAYCMTAGRDLVSLEQNIGWFRIFRDRYQSGGHRFACDEYDILIDGLTILKWGVAFIDNSPGGERRAKDFATFLPVSDFVVVHDYWRENEESIAPLIGAANFHVCKTYEPPTLVASATLPIPKALLRM